MDMIIEWLMKSYVSEENNCAMIISNVVPTKHQPNTAVVWFGNLAESWPQYSSSSSHAIFMQSSKIKAELFLDDWTGKEPSEVGQMQFRLSPSWKLWNGDHVWNWPSILHRVIYRYGYWQTCFDIYGFI